MIAVALLFLAAAGIIRHFEPEQCARAAATTYTIANPSVTAGAFTCDFGISSVCRVNLNGTITATPTIKNMVDGGLYTMEIEQDSIGHPVIMPSPIVDQGGGAAPPIAQLASQIDTLQLYFVASPLATATAQMYIVNRTTTSSFRNKCGGSLLLSSGIANATASCLIGGGGAVSTPLIGCAVGGTLATPTNDQVMCSFTSPNVVNILSSHTGSTTVDWWQIQ